MSYHRPAVDKLQGPSQQPKGAGSAYCLFPEKETEKKRVTCLGPPSWSVADPSVKPPQFRLQDITFHMKPKTLPPI